VCSKGNKFMVNSGERGPRFPNPEDSQPWLFVSAQPKFRERSLPEASYFFFSSTPCLPLTTLPLLFMPLLFSHPSYCLFYCFIPMYSSNHIVPSFWLEPRAPPSANDGKRQLPSQAASGQWNSWGLLFAHRAHLTRTRTALPSSSHPLLLNLIIHSQLQVDQLPS
jgi:hypothetical protein